ncbi:hypothetical protein ACT3UD_14510 [Glutamicibacter sp. 287]
MCVKVFEENVKSKLALDHRPGLSAVIAYLRPDDMLTAQEVGRLGRKPA